MARKILAALVAVVGLVAWPIAAQAYPAPPAPTIESTEDEITPGDTVVFTFDNWQPGGEVTVTVEADGVDGNDIGLEVLGSTSVVATADATGAFDVAITFPEAAVYTITATGPNLDGDIVTVSLVIDVSAGGSEIVGGTGDLPQTGFAGRGWLLAGAALLGVGGALAGGAALTRRRSASRTPAAS